MPAIKESEERDAAKLKAILDERDWHIHGRIDAYELRVTKYFRTTLSSYLTSIQKEIDRLRSEVTALDTTGNFTPIFSYPPTFTIDLFSEEELP